MPALSSQVGTALAATLTGVQEDLDPEVVIVIVRPRSADMVKRDLDNAWQKRRMAQRESGKQQSIIINLTGDIAKLIDELASIRNEEAYHNLLSGNVPVGGR